MSKSTALLVAGRANCFGRLHSRGDDDQEIADVLTFVRAGWGNKAPAVDKAAIASSGSPLVAIWEAAFRN
jgi:hypothetical protein